MSELKKIIEKNLLIFGYLPLLYINEIFIKEEKYEICGLILQTLNKYSKNLKFNIPKEYNENAIEEMKYIFMKNFNLSGNITENNHIEYANIILIEINEEIKKK